MAGRFEDGCALDGELEPALEPLGNPAVRPRPEGSRAPTREFAEIGAGGVCVGWRKLQCRAERRVRSIGRACERGGYGKAVADISSRHERGSSARRARPAAERRCAAWRPPTSTPPRRAPSRLQPIECAVRGTGGFAGGERLDHVGVRRIRQYRAALRLPAIEARFGLHERDLHRRAGIFAGQLSELPLAREHPERVLDRGRKTAPGVATTGDRFDSRERVDGGHAGPFATQRTGN